MALDAGPFMRTRTRGSPSWPTTLRRKAGYVFADCSEHQTQTACRRGGPYVAPVASAWTLAMVLSIRTYSKSGVSAKAWNSLCHTGVRPAAEPGMNPAPLAEHLRQITPACRVASHPQNSVHEQPVVGAAASPHPRSARKIAFDPSPLLVRQRASAQGLTPSPALNQNRRTNRILQMQTEPRASRLKSGSRNSHWR